MQKQWIRNLAIAGVFTWVVWAPLSVATEPALNYSTYLGGSREDLSRGIAVDANGVAYVAGRTDSRDFPVTDGSLPAQVFVAKLNPAGNGTNDLIWATYVGSTDRDGVAGVGVDAVGNVYVQGRTGSNAFPTTDGTAGPGIFVIKLSSDGSTVLYATVLGAAAGGVINGDLFVDAAGNAYVLATTDDANFYTTTGPGFGGGVDAVVVKLDPDGAVVYSRFLGGSGVDEARGITVDADGNVHVTGRTVSTDFPTVGAFQDSLNGDSDEFVARLSPDGSTVTYSTYLGGSDGEGGRGGDIAVDSNGHIHVTGRTSSSDFPTVNAFEPTSSGGTEVFFAKLDPAAGAGGLLYGTYLGGTSGERGTGIAVDSAGNAYIVGRTLSKNFPTTTDAFDTTYNGRHDNFLAKIDPGLSGTASLVVSTYLGGKLDDSPGRVALLDDGMGGVRAYLNGLTKSDNFPITAGAFQEDRDGHLDSIVMRMDFAPLGPPECMVDDDCDDGVACTEDACLDGNCVFTPNDVNCPDDGVFCNGTENCDPVWDCVSSGNPCPPGTTCNETSNLCDEQTCQPKNAPCELDDDCCSGICKPNGRCR